MSTRALSAMHLNHLNLTVDDPIATQEFLVKYFGLTVMGKPNKNMCFLSDDKGMVLSLTHYRVARESEVRYPATFHVGFIQESPAKVDEMHRRLTADGYDAPAPSQQHGSWTFYFVAPGGFTIEVLA